MTKDKEEQKDNSRDLPFGCLLLAEAIHRMRDISGWISSEHKPVEKATKTTGDSKLKIRFMTEAEVMEYLIQISNEKK